MMRGNFYQTRGIAAKVAFIALSLVLAFSAGCGKQEEKTAETSKAVKTPELAKAATAPVKKSLSQIKLAGIIFQDDQFFHLVRIGMKTAAEKAGVQILLENDNFKVDREIALINTYLTQGVDAIVLSPVSFKSSYTALKQARDKGAKIVTYNTDVTGDLASSFIESDQFQLGASTGKVARAYIEKNLGGKAKLAILAFKTAEPESSKQRVDGFKSGIANMPGVEIVAEQDAWLVEMSVKKTGDILTANPAINVIWSANEGGTIGAVMAVKNAGKVGKIAVFGTDANEQLADLLLSNDNTLQAVTGQQPFEIGTLAVQTAIKVVQGEPVQKKVSLPGVLLTRDKPEEIQKFKARLKELTR